MKKKMMLKDTKPVSINKSSYTQCELERPTEDGRGFYRDTIFIPNKYAVVNKTIFIHIPLDEKPKTKWKVIKVYK